MKTLLQKLWTSEAAGVGLIASLMVLGAQLASRQPVDVPTVLLPFATGLGVGTTRTAAPPPE